MGSHFHLVNSNVVGLHCHRLYQKDYIDSLQKKYLSLLVSCYGPKGNYALIRNPAGHDVVTASSAVVLQHLHFHHPSFKFINSLILSQHKTFGVYGLFVGILCSTLLYKILLLEKEVPFSVLNEISSYIIKELLQHLIRKPPSVILKIDFGCFDHNLSIVKSIISSKKSSLTSKEIDHLAIKIIEAHVRTIPSAGSGIYGHVHISEVIGPSTLSTTLIEGVLFRQSEYTIEELEIVIGRIPETNIKVVLFNVPFSPDSSLTTEIEWLGENSIHSTLDKFIFEELIYNLRRNNISIIANQKFMHPILIYDLQKAGFLVLERLGTDHADLLVKISGCKAIASISNLEDINDYSAGILSSVQAISIEEKYYINLKSADLCQNLTMFLRGINESEVSYMQECVESSLHLLRSTIQESEYCPGSGCLEAYLSNFLVSFVNENITSISEKFDVSSSKVEKVFKLFVRSLLSLCIVPHGGVKGSIHDYAIDSTFNHLWILDESSTNNENEDPVIPTSQISSTCVCGLLNKKENGKRIYEWRPLAMMNCDVDRGNFSKFRQCVPKSCLLKDEISSSAGDNAVDCASLSFKKGCVIDNYRAKLNSIRLAFEGFLQLYSVGNCIFDK